MSKAKWFAVSLVLFWLSILGHEYSHFGTAALVYTPEELRTGGWSPKQQLMSVGAGPLFTLLLLLVASLGFRNSMQDRWRLIWTILVASAASRIAIVGPGTLLGTAINDERTIGPILGISPRLIWSIEALVALLCVAMVVRSWPLNDRPRVYRLVVSTVVVGWATTLVFGPMLGLPI